MYAIISSSWIWAAIIFAIAGLTDMLDGMVARWLRQETIIGKYLDPLADKILITGCYSALWWVSDLPSWFLYIVIIKELLLIIGAASIVHRFIPRPTIVAKFNTALQILSVLILLIPYSFIGFSSQYFLMLLGTIVILHVITLVQYARVALEGFKL